MLSATMSLIISVIATYAAFSYSFAGWGGLCWLATPLLGRALVGHSPRNTSLLLGFYSFFCWLAISWWLAIGVNSMNSSYPLAGYLVVLTLSFLSAVPYWVCGYLFGKLGYFDPKRMRPLTAAAVLTVMVELWPARLPGTLGHALYQSTTVIQIVELGGTGLLSFLVYGTGFALVATIQSHAPRRLRYLVLATVPLIVTLIYGSNRLQFWDSYLQSAPQIKISMVQPNLPIVDSPSPDSDGNSLDTLVRQTAELLRDETRQQLIVWPEIPIFFAPSNNSESEEALNQLLRGKATPLLANADLQTNDTVYDRVPFYNTVQLFQGSSAILQEYRKMILVPFGEYLPLENWMTGPRWERILSGYRRYVPGSEVVVLEPLPGLRVGTPVCLEALHTEHVAQMVQLGANILVNPANDAYFGTTRGAEIDFALTVFRATEYRIPMVRVTNSGISALVDQRGIVDPSSQMKPFSADVRTVSVSPSAEIRRIPPRAAGIIGLSLFALLSVVGSLCFRWLKGGSVDLNPFR